MPTGERAADADLVTAFNRLQVVLGTVPRVPLSEILSGIVDASEKIPYNLPPSRAAVLRLVVIANLSRLACASPPHVAADILFATSAIMAAPEVPLSRMLREWSGVCGRRARGHGLIATTREDPRVGLALAYIQTHYSEQDLRVTQVAHALRMSRWHLARLLKKDTGDCFTGHLKRVRLAIALPLLRCPILSLKEIAASVGYHDAASFSKDFRSAYGICPRQWRRIDQCVSQPAGAL